MIRINNSDIQGTNIVICNGKITVDGKTVKEFNKENQIIIEGPVNGNIEADIPITVNGDVTGNIKTSGPVNCDNVGGDITTAGPVNCDDVQGSVHARMVNADTIYNKNKGE